MPSQDIAARLLECSCSTSFSHKCEPRKPLPPVTSIFFIQRKAKSPVIIKQLKTNIFKSIIETAKTQGLKKIGFESRHLAFAECEILNKLKDKRTLLIPLKETIEPLREIKEKEEIENIKKALVLTQATYSFIKKKLKPGVSELELAAEIEYFIRQNGARSSAFDIIVASGPNSSYPHAQVSDRRLCSNEPVVIDMSIEYNGYKCDLTRTFFLGKIKPIVQKAHDAILSAQQKAIRASGIELGGSFATGDNAKTGGGHRTNVEGLDLTYKWRDPQYGLYKSLTWMNEILFSQKEEGAEDTVNSHGMYSSLEYQFNREWSIFGRYDYTQFPDSSSLHENSYTTGLTFHQSEFMFWRAQFEHTNGENYAGNVNRNEIWLQADFLIGLHPAHQY